MNGIYCLIIKVENDTFLQIGALGSVEFKKSHYAYIGSAQINLEKRVERHLSSHKKIRWHIDYLLSYRGVNIDKVFVKQAVKAEECITANRLLQTGEGIRGFGCSDCSCFSHLIRAKGGEIVALLKDRGFIEYTG